MELPVLIERVEGNGYRASTSTIAGVAAEGSTQEEAMAGLRSAIEKRLDEGAVLTSLELPEPDPWQAMKGMWKDDPLFDEWQEAIEEYRRTVDADPNTF